MIVGAGLALWLVACQGPPPDPVAWQPPVREPLFLEAFHQEVGFGRSSDEVWVYQPRMAARFVDGERTWSGPADEMLADGRGPALTAAGRALTIHDGTSAPVLLEDRVIDLERFDDGSFVVLGHRLLVRHGPDGAVLDQIAHGEAHPYALVLFGEEVRLLAGTRLLRWADDGMQELPRGAVEVRSRDGRWRLEGRSVVREDTGETVLELPWEVHSPLWWGDRMVARRDRDDGAVLVWADLGTADVHTLVSRGVSQLRASPDGRWAVGSTGRVVQFLDLRHGRWGLEALHHWSRDAEILAVSDDGSRVVSGDGYGRRILWTRDGGAVELAMPTRLDSDWSNLCMGNPRRAGWAVFSPDETRLVTVSDGGAFTVHDASGTLLWRGHSNRDAEGEPYDAVHGCSQHDRNRAGPPPRFSPDGTRLFTVGKQLRESLVLGWDVGSGEVVEREVFASLGEAATGLPVPMPTPPERTDEVVLENGRVRFR